MDLEDADVMLYDPFPSAVCGHMAIRQCLWDLVERVSGPLVEHEQSICVEESQPVVVSDPSLPNQFTGRGICFKSGTKSNKKRQQGVRADPYSTLTFSEHRSECNLYMALNKTDGMYYPCRILGVGPLSSGPCPQFSAVTYLGYGTYDEIERCTGLIEIPVDRREEAQQLVYHETISKTCGYGDHSKYYDQRYRLFSRFDYGILLDDESWYSITPEVIAKYIAMKCAQKAAQMGKTLGIVLDCFCGVGGNVIALAQYCKMIWAGDVDANKIEMLRTNAGVYGVRDRVEPIHCDAYILLASIAAHKKEREISMVDIILLAPPWGGVNYTAKTTFNLRTMIACGDGVHLLALALQACANVIYVLPKNSSRTQLRNAAREYGVSVRIENMHIHGKSKMIVAYFGSLFDNV